MTGGSLPPRGYLLRKYAAPPSACGCLHHAVRTQSRLTRSRGGSTIAGTFGYMSPEQTIGRPTPQSDTYALAALFTYIISGVDPAEMKTQDLRLIIDPYVENHPVALVQTLRGLPR